MKWRRPCIFGIESRDCGPASLCTVAKWFGYHLGLAECREAAQTDAQGTSLYKLYEAAVKLGFEASCGIVRRDKISSLPLPAIVCFSDTAFGHIVVLYKITRTYLLIADPALGLTRLDSDLFFNRWQGHALLLVPGPFLHSTPDRRPSLFSLYRLAANERWLIPASVLSGLLSIGLGFANAIFLRVLLDRVLPHKDYHNLTSWLSAVLASAVFALLVGWCRSKATVLIGTRLEIKLGRSLLSTMFALPLEDLERCAPGDLASRISDVTNLRNVIVGSVANSLLDTASLILVLGLLLFYSVPLTVGVGICLVALFALMWMSNDAILGSERGMRMLFSSLNGSLVDLLSHVKVLRVFNAENEALDRLSGHHKRWQEALGKRLQHGETVRCLLNFTTTTGSLGILAYGALLTLQGRLTTGQMLLFYSCMLMALLDRVGPNVGSLQQASIALERLNSIQELAIASGKLFTVSKYESQDSTASCHLPTKRNYGETVSSVPHVRFVNVSFAYKNRQAALIDCSFDLPPGSWTYLMGRSGSGKSTIASIIAGLYPLQEGNVMIDAIDIRSLQNAQLRAIVGVVFQEAGIVRASIRENIALGRADASIDDIIRAAELAEIHSFISTLPRGYNFNIGSSGVTLSSGQKQRLALARVFLQNPPVLILDEATSHLDLETERKIIDNLSELRQYTTTLMITHRMTPPERAYRLMQITNGRVYGGAPSTNGTGSIYTDTEVGAHL
jgi:ABC-type bacteriocin/lantibiotic exporter with double-glycine peptidase domain